MAVHTQRNILCAVPPLILNGLGNLRAEEEIAANRSCRGVCRHPGQPRTDRARDVDIQSSRITCECVHKHESPYQLGTFQSKHERDRSAERLGEEHTWTGRFQGANAHLHKIVVVVPVVLRIADTANIELSEEPFLSEQQPASAVHTRQVHNRKFGYHFCTSSELADRFHEYFVRQPECFPGIPSSLLLVDRTSLWKARNRRSTRQTSYALLDLLHRCSHCREFRSGAAAENPDRFRTRNRPHPESKVCEVPHQRHIQGWCLVRYTRGTPEIESGSPRQIGLKRTHQAHHKQRRRNAYASQGRCPERKRSRSAGEMDRR